MSDDTTTRRDALALLGSGVAAVTGCTGAPGSTGDDTTTAPTATATATDTPVPTEPPGTPTDPEWESVGLEETGTTCGGTPNVEFRETGERIRVVGTLVVASLCYRAGLRTATVDDGVARLVVVPRTIATDGTPACGQCIADATFEITGSFTGGRPDELVVELRGQEPGTYRTAL